jgi:ankyrin repeat protein
MGLESLGWLELFQSNEFGLTPRNFMLEAARSGSLSAKRTLIFALGTIWGDAQPTITEQHDWVIESLLSDMPNYNDFIGQLKRNIPDLLTHNELFKELIDSLTILLHKESADGLCLDVTGCFDNAAYEIIQGNIHGLRRILSSNVLEERSDGQALIHIASRFGKHEIALLLVREYDVDIDLLNDDGLTALSIAAISRQEQTATMLINAGADFRYLFDVRVLRLVANDGPQSILRSLAEYFEIWSQGQRESFNEQPVDLGEFLNGNFSWNSHNESGEDPQCAPIFASILGNNIRCLWALLELGCSHTVGLQSLSTSADGIVVNDARMSPIHFAASQLRPWDLAILLQFGVNPQLPTDDNYRQVALHYACVASRNDTYKFPYGVSNSFVPSSEDAIEPTLLIRTRLLMVQILVKCYKADVNARDAHGRSALFFCMSSTDSLQIIE